MRSAEAGYDGEAGFPHADPGPRLLRWLDQPDPQRSDAVLVALLTTVSFLGLIAGIKIGHPAWPEYRDPDLVGAVLVLSQVAPLLVVRRHPTTAFAVTSTADLVGNLVGVPPLPAGAIVLLTIYLGIVHCRIARQLAIFGGLVGVFLALHGLLLTYLGLPFSVVLTRVWLGALVVAAAIAGRTVLAYRRRTAAAEAHSAARIRNEILRDLHDGVAHGLTTIVVQAEVAQARLSDLHGGAGPVAADSLTSIASIGRRSLVDLRRLLAGLEHPDPVAHDQPEAPVPGLSAVPDLLSRAAGSDRPSTLTELGRPTPLPGAVEETLYRVVQESVTNALRHAGTASDVTIVYGPGVVEMTVDNDLSAPPSGAALPPGHGRGTTSMRERVEACGGVLAAGPGPDGGYRVHVRIPFPGRP